MGMEKFVTGLRHIGIPVQSVADAIEQYKALGFSVDELITIPGTQRHISIMSNNGVSLELYESIDPNNHSKVDHYALAVDDIEAAFAEAKALGMNVLNESIGQTDFVHGSNRYFTVMMPSGEKVEFNQAL